MTYRVLSDVSSRSRAGLERVLEIIQRFMEHAPRFGPEDIRKIRGTLSRAAFAREVGVSPLTVYRWELPDDAPESRRPSGRAIGGLTAFVSRGRSPAGNSVAAVAPATGFEGADHSRLWALFGRLGRGEFRAVEEELLSLLASDALRTPASRALAAVGLALVHRLGRDDLRAAFSAIAPHIPLADSGELPPDVSAWVHTAAAVVFAGFDGRLFDAGKVNAYVARAERALPQFGQSEVRALLRFAEVHSAFNLGEPELIRRALERAHDGLFGATEPVLRCVAGDIRANEAIVAGQGSLASRRLADVAQDAASIGFALVETRMHGFLGTRRLEEAQNPSEALACTSKAREVARLGGLSTGFCEVHVARVEAEALLRLGRFDDARKALDAGERALNELRWPAFMLGPTRARLCRYTGRGGEVRAAGQRLLAFDLPLLRGLNRAYAEYLLAVADWIDGETSSATAHFGEALAQAQAAGGWMFLQRECLMYGLAARIAESDLDGAEESVRAVERMLERLPSAWWTAVLRRQQGILRCAQGRPEEGRQHLEAALGTFTLAGDVPEAAYTRRALALAAAALGEPQAVELLARSEEELARAGMAMPANLRVGAFPKVSSVVPSGPVRAESAGSPFPVRSLLVPFQRLAVRGVGPALLQRELVAVARETFPNRAVALQEVDSEGVARDLVPGPTVASPELFELGDGMGRRLRLCVEGPLSDHERSGAAALSSFASLAMEISALRGYAEQTAAVRGQEDVDPIPGFVAASSSLKRLKADLSRLSGSRATVIVSGESGSGKEVVARAIHELSARRERPYVAFNCASVPRELFEGQLFGFRRGSFSGATSDNPGVLRAAAGGTVFLDEIGELPLELQPKLLRFLENGEIFPLGDTRPIQVDVRIIAATHRDLAQLVRDGRFREDLYYRLHVVPLRVPSLRERPEDIVPLARHFVAHLTPAGAQPPALSPDALAALVAHPWPGNVRELRNVIERSMAFAPTPAVLTADHLRIGG